MTRPKRAPKPTKVKAAVDPAVQTILDQVGTEVAPAPSIWETPVVDKMSIWDKTTVFSKAVASSVFDRPAGAPVFDTPAATGKAAVFTKRVSNIWHQRPKTGKGARKFVMRTFVMPPLPEGPPKRAGYWLSVCEFLNSFEDSGYYEELWRPGRGWDFDDAAESQGYQCAGGGAYYEPDSVLHIENPEGWCEQHYLGANYAANMEDILVPCDYAFHDVSPLWQEAVPLLQRLRALALERVVDLVDVPPTVEYMFSVAGMRFREISDDPQQEIIDAVRSGDTDTGLAAAFADTMIRDYPLVFGEDGIVLDQLYSDMEKESWIQQYPEQVIIFERLADNSEGHHPAELRGCYVVCCSEYVSALTRDESVVRAAGFLGWLVHHAVPSDGYSGYDP